VGCGAILQPRAWLGAFLIGFAAQALLAASLAAQAPATAAPAQAHSGSAAAAKSTAQSHSPARKHRKPIAAKTAAAPAPRPVPAAVVPAAPPLPDWPANNKPVLATVVWNSGGLLIHASNSSLEQILNDVSLKTGARVEGMGADERIFGTYGPGSARDVLAQLLDGSDYNVLMVGDRGQGTPRRIVLSGRPNGQSPAPGSAIPAGNNDNDSENNQEPPPGQFEPNQALGGSPLPGAAAPGTPARTQQMLEERQREILQQQQNNPQN
jgi:hypothetical protein